MTTGQTTRTRTSRPTAAGAESADATLLAMVESQFQWDLAYEWTSALFWEGREFTLYLQRSLTSVQEEELRRLFESWYEVGAWGGYGWVEDAQGVLDFLGPIVV